MYLLVPTSTRKVILSTVDVGYLVIYMVILVFNRSFYYQRLVVRLKYQLETKILK